MNILHFIVVGIVTLTGYLLHNPLVGEKGVFSSLMNPKDTTEQPGGGLVKTPDNTVSPKNGGSSGEVANPVSPRNDETPEVRPSEFALKHVISTDFPATCKMTRSGQSILNGQPFDLDLNTVLVPKSINGDILEATITSPSLGVTVKVPVGLTNFEELVRPVTMARLKGLTPPPKPKDSDIPEPIVDNTSQDQDPVEVPVDPAPPQVDPPAPKVVKIADDQIENLMKQGSSSLSVLKDAEGGQISVTGDENIDGQSYQVGVLKFKKKTLLGTRELSVKALVADGKIQRWIWSESGQEVR